jgi:hypothetical protein
VNSTSALRLGIIFQLLLIIACSCAKKSDVSLWDVVDENSILIFESVSNKDSLLNSIIPFTLNSRHSLLTVQKKSKSEIDLVYVFKSRPGEIDSFLVKSTMKGKDLKLSNRNYDGFKIYDFLNNQNTVTLSFTLIEDVLVASKSPLLVENAVRIYQSKVKLNFKDRSKALFEFALLKNDVGNLYISLNGLSDIVSITPDFFSTIPILKDWSNKAVYDIAKTPGYLVMNGFALASDTSLSYFQQHQPVPITVARFIPNYANSIIHFGISEFDIKSKSDSGIIKEKNSITELAIISQESSKNLIAIARIPENHLNKLQLFTNEYSESYADNELKSINQPLIKSIYSQFLPDKNFAFGFMRENYLIMTETLDDLKLLIDANETEDTWGKTRSFQLFNERCLQESNISIFTRQPKLIIESNSFYRENQSLFNELNLNEVSWGALQYSALNNNFYTSFILGHETVGRIESKPNKEVESKLVGNSINLKKVFVVKNLNTLALLSQGEDNTISLISPTEGVLWKYPTNEEINSDVYLIDYYKNGKFQYLFSTKNKVYVIDRLGRIITGFPKSISGNIQYLSLVDYDKSKNYRYLISTESNSLYLFDKDLNNLKDWGPKTLPSLALTPSQHFRSGGKDYFIAILKDGSVNLFSRSGASISKFQLSKRDNISGDYFISVSTSINSSSIYFVDKDGRVTQYSFDGKLVANYNLVRGNKSSFVLRRTLTGNKFYFVRVDTDKLAVFGSDGKLIFERQNGGSTNLDVQIIERSSTKAIFSFYDVDQKVNYLYDQLGSEILPALESEVAPVFGTLNSKSPLMFYTFPKNSIVVKTIE